MKTHKLTTRQVGFMLGTRIMLAAGLGLLLSEKLPEKLRRTLAIGLVSFGGLTTVPVLRTLFAK